MQTIRSPRRPAAGLVTLAVLLSPGATRADLAASLQMLADAGPGPSGQETLAAAWREASQAAIDQLPLVLSAMGEATPVGQNWLRAAADALAERRLAQTGSLPTSELEQFVADRSQPPRGRRVAFEWLTRVDETAASRLLPTMLDDPSLELRYDAVASVMAAGEEASDPAEQKRLFRTAFEASRDVAQTQDLAEKLSGLGEQVDIASHMGFIAKWRLIGPFDNSELQGFHAEYAPERNLDLQETAEGVDGPVTWKVFTSTDKLGVVNLNEAIGNKKSVVAYALATLHTARDQHVEIRLASQNAVKVWINGREAAAYEVYHTGSELDQYVAAAALNAGQDNTVLVKVCQNAKSQPWEQDWQFQLRVTDSLGGAADVTAH